MTVLFVDLVQSTEIIRTIGDEAMADLLDELMDGIARIVDGLGGTVAEVMGDGVLCMFGAPVAHEDDPERALRAALAIRHFVTKISPIHTATAARQPQVRIGVHTGGVVMRTIGQDYRLAYTAIGDAVHMTQRLEAAANPGEILVSSKVQQLVASLFRFSRPESFTLKGFGDPQVAVRLLGLRDAVERRPIHADRATLVGRERDLAELQRRLDGLVAGLGGVITVWGEAGIGKSRLVAELREHAPKTITWLDGRALSYAQNAPYSIIGQQVRRTAGIGEDDTERSARDKLSGMVLRTCGTDQAGQVYPFIATALGMRLEGSEAELVDSFSSDALQHEVLRSLRTLFSAMARRAPLVLVFEDLHWSDRASVAAVDSLLPLLDDHPILFVLVARPDTDAPSWTLRQKLQTDYPHYHTNLDLGPLSDEASASLAMNLLQVDRIPADLRQVVLNKAEGVPLYVEELTKSLIEQGSLTKANGGWRLTVASHELQVPSTLQGIVLARLDRLEDPVKRVLQVASVIGPVVLYRVLSEVSGSNGQLPVRLRDLQRRELLQEIRRRPEVEFAFKHALIRDVAYHTLLGRERKRLHYSVGEAMEVILKERLSEFQSIIAEHFLRAQAWEKAAEYLIRAADESTRLYAHTEARAHYDKAVEALNRLPDTVVNRRRRVDTTVKQVAVSFIADSPDLNLARLAEAEAVARELPTTESPKGEDRLRLARVHYWTGRIHHVRGDPPKAIGYFKQVLSVGQEVGDQQLTALPLATLALPLTVQGQWAEAKRLLSQAVPALEKSGEWGEWCRAVGYLGVSIAACGDYHRGLQEAERGLNRAKELEDWTLIASNHVLLCVVHLQNERIEAVTQAAQEAIQASKRAREQILHYAGLALRGWAEARL
ncbi:MAG: AAA family ATPase, partial [Chloroflexota bacterium]|nr:AAA family ATPase [Chloroflexota bacterium]